MPLRLNSWLVSKGGVQDPSGDVLSGVGAHKFNTVRVCDRPGLIRKNGMLLDNAALLAWEAGYFPEHSERPSINDLLDAIAQDHLGRVPVYSEHDSAAVERERQARMPDELESHDPAREMLTRIVEAWRSGAGKRDRLRPLMREAERMVA